jgi:hypothetical protein
MNTCREGREAGMSKEVIGEKEDKTIVGMCRKKRKIAAS